MAPAQRSINRVALADGQARTVAGHAAMWDEMQCHLDARYDCAVPAELYDVFFPVLLSTMQEPLADAELQAYFTKVAAIADTGLRTGTRHVVIVLNDVTKFTAAARKQVANAQARYITREQVAATLVAYVPNDSAFARGLVTAMRWISPEIVARIEFVASLDIALRKALSMLAANGTPFTGDEPALRRALGLRR
jgi:hypothetical protein